MGRPPTSCCAVADVGPYPDQAPRAAITPDPLGGNGGGDVQGNAFSIKPLPPGTYTVSFPPHLCRDALGSGCNGHYLFSPVSAPVTIVDDDVDVAFVATLL